MKLLHAVVLALTFWAPKPKPPVVPPPLPPDIQWAIDNFCFPEINPKIGGFWVIGPDDSVTYSTLSCFDAILKNNNALPALHTKDGKPISVTRIKLDK